MQKMSLILKWIFKKWKYFFMQNDIFHIWTDWEENLNFFPFFGFAWYTVVILGDQHPRKMGKYISFVNMKIQCTLTTAYE